MDEEALKQKILDIALPIVQAQGLAIWGLELIGGPRVTVRLFVEAPGNADKSEQGPMAGIDECEKISRQLDLAIEVENLFDKPWTLEVSTPGFSRRFFTAVQMTPYIGDIVEARLVAPLAGYPGDARVLRGRLTAVDGQTLTLEPCSISADGVIVSENLPPAVFPFDAARRVGRIHVFTPPPKPGGKKSRK